MTYAEIQAAIKRNKAAKDNQYIRQQVIREFRIEQLKVELESEERREFGYTEVEKELSPEAEFEGYMTVKQAAKYVGIDYTTLYRLFKYPGITNIRCKRLRKAKRKPQLYVSREDMKIAKRQRDSGKVRQWFKIPTK